VYLQTGNRQRGGCLDNTAEYPMEDGKPDRQMNNDALTTRDDFTRTVRLNDYTPDGRVKALRAMALGWLKRGRVTPAIVKLREAIETDPLYLDGYLDLGRVLLQQRLWRDLDALCRRGLRYHIEIAELHKLLITAREEHGSWEDAAECYRLERVDKVVPKIGSHEILCCVVVRDERARLPWFLDYYRRLGVDRFLFIDNGSTDGTGEWLMRQHDVSLWRSELEFKVANFGSAWFELLLRRLGAGHWCLTVDIDEFLVYEGAPNRSLKAFCSDLDRRGKQAATGVLLDMYSDRPIRETVYRENDDPLTLCPFFDRTFYHKRSDMEGPYKNQTIFFGGVRQRVFPAEHDYFLSKAVLLRYQRDVVLTSGQHLTNIGAPLIAGEEICLLHFKFLSSLVRYAQVEAEREVHAMQGEQYKAYHNGLEQNPGLNLYDQKQSVRFEGTAQLRRLGILQAEGPVPAPQFPTIAPVRAEHGDRPFWSVMITAFRRPENIGRVLSSVLGQMPEPMQVEVVCDMYDEGTQQEIAAEVRRVGGDSVVFTALKERLGHPEIFNHCIERAKGQWVHILHDDDWVEPGFYSGLRAGIESCPDADAAFCNHRVIDETTSDLNAWHSWTERETPGLIDDWVERIAVCCRVQFSAMTVRRAVYEALGGFCAQAGSAFDWEMWIRIAARHKVFYLPECRLNVGRDHSAESSMLSLSGTQVSDAFQAVEVAARHLPPDRSESLVQKARDFIAREALRVAAGYLGSGNTKAVLANIRAAVAGRPSERTLARLTEFLQGVSHEYEG